MAALERLVQSVVEFGELPTLLVRDVGPTWAAETGATAQAKRQLASDPAVTAVDR